jgi:hypothetical protein
MLQILKPCYITYEMEAAMADEKLRIGKKGKVREIAKKLSEIRNKPISKEVLKIVEEISERNKRSDKKIAGPTDVEI